MAQDSIWGRTAWLKFKVAASGAGSAPMALASSPALAGVGKAQPSAAVRGANRRRAASHPHVHLQL